MSYKFIIQSHLTTEKHGTTTHYAIDLSTGSSGTPVTGANVNVYPQHSSQPANQLWQIMPSVDRPGYYSEYYYIKSLSGNFVIDIKGGGTHPNDGTLLDGNTQQPIVDGGYPADNGNQLWKLVTSDTSDYFYLESQLTSNGQNLPLVIDIKGGAVVPGGATHLQAYHQKTPSTDHKNQIWKFIVPANDNSYYGGAIAPFYIEGQNQPGNSNSPIIYLSGGEFFPGTKASIAFTYKHGSHTTSGTLHATADLCGNFPGKAINIPVEYGVSGVLTCTINSDTQTFNWFDNEFVPVE